MATQGIINREGQILLLEVDDIDKEITEIEDALKEMKKKEFSLASSVENLQKQVEDERIAEEFLKLHRLEIQDESPEVEYKRRLEERFSYKNADLIRRIYKENREQAKTAHNNLVRFNYNRDDLKLPLYTQPSDLPLYHENVEKFKDFRPKLLLFLQRKRRAEIKLDKYLHRKYENNRNNWIKTVEKMESNPKRKQKQQRARQFYEREFPEIKKHREQQERFDRLGLRSIGYIRSEAEVEEIADNLREKESSEKKMQLLAVMAPCLLDNYERKIRYINNNGLIRDLEQFEIKRKEAIIWNEKEKMIFSEKYAQYPKWFEKIASFLDVKSCSDCVMFYYLNKKKQHFHSTKSKKKKGKPTRTGAMSLKLDNNKQKQNKQGKDDVDVELDDDDDEGSAQSEDETNTTLPTPDLTAVDDPAEVTLIKTEEEHKITPLLTTELPVISEAEKTSLPKQKTNPQPFKIFNTRSGKFQVKPNNGPPTKSVSTELICDKATFVQSSIDASHPPLKITIVVTSPSNTEGQFSTMSVASIVSETVTAANMCAEITTIIPISNDSTNSYFNVEDLIRQHLSKMPEHSDPSRWSEGEMLKAVEGLKRFGRDWVLISRLVETKSEAQCKNFYFNYKKKFNLESILGISRTTEKGDASSTEPTDENLIAYIDELEEEDQTESKTELSAENLEQEKAETKVIKSEIPDRATKSCPSTNKPLDGNNQAKEINTVDDIDTSFSDNVETRSEDKLHITQDHASSDYSFMGGDSVPECEDVRDNLVSELNDHKEITEHFFNVSSESARPPPPPPLFTHVSCADTLCENLKSECSPITEISLKGDIGLFEQKLEYSIDRETILKASSPNLSAEEFKSQLTSVSADIDDTKIKARRCRSSLPDLQLVNHSPTLPSNPRGSPGDPAQYITFHGQRERPVRPQIFQGKVPHPSHQLNRFQSLNSNLSVVEQNVAIQAFNSYQGYMTSLPQNSSHSDVTSPRFKYPVAPSPGNVADHVPLGHNMSQTRPLIQHSLPITSNPQPIKSPVIAKPNNNFGQLPVEMRSSPIMQGPYAAHYSHEELQNRRELELFHRQREPGQLNELMIRREIENERDPQIRFRRQNELNYMHMKQLEFEKRREEATKQARFRQQQRLFAEKFLEHGPMSQEMVHSLVQRHFNQFDNAQMEKPRERHEECCPPEDVLNYPVDARDKYLRHLPLHPRNRAELQQRTASIPDLRTNHSSDAYPPDKAMRRDIMRNAPNADVIVSVPDQCTQERFANHRTHSPSQVLAAMPYDKFGDLENPNIAIPKITLEPLSRPGSANSEISSGSGAEQRVYGISTGLVRKPPSLSSITGVQSMPSVDYRSETFSPDSLNSPSPSGKQNSSRIYPRVKTAIDQESSQRKSIIVRPWEIGVQIPKLTDLSKQGAAPQLIQLAPTSTKYKEQIINIAQKNSPAPETFPKFNFRTSGGDKEVNFDKISNTTREDRATSADKNATVISPGLPDMNENENNIDDPDNDENCLIRPRSDSEETVSADEVEAQESIHCSTTIYENSQATPTPLLIQRLTDLPQEKSIQNDTIDDPKNMCCDTSVNNNGNYPDVVNPAPSHNILSSTLEKNKQLNVHNQELQKQIMPKNQNRLKESICKGDTSIISEQEDAVQPRDLSEHCNQHVLEELIQRTNQNDYDMELPNKCAANLVTFDVTSITHDNRPNSQLQHEIGVSLEGLELVNNSKNESLKDAKNCGTIKPERAIDIPETLEEKEIHPESPDIYDDLKVHQYDEQTSNSPFDLYSEIKSNTDDELIKISSFKDSPSSDAEFFYTTSENVTSNMTSMPIDSTELCENISKEGEDEPNGKKDDGVDVDDDGDDDEDDEEILKLTSGKEMSNVDARSDAGTPVMDEPCNSISSAHPLKIGTLKQQDKAENACSINSETSPGSTPEARTPLLDEPEYHFEPVKPIMDNLNAAFGPYNNQMPRQSVPDETALTGAQTRIDYLRVFGKTDTKQEAFESITPPSSPENDQCVSSRTQTVSSAGQTTASVAFPFSALAFNVHSRPSSRAGSSCHSPLPQDERSPRNEKMESTAPKHRSKRSCERDGDSPHSSHSQSLDVSRIQKRDFRRSGSQSSSSSFSKSPEYEYKQRKSFTDRHTDIRESNRKQKRGSSSPGYEGNYNKRPRT